ncbi:MAG TPA: YraN family protein [Pseudothermotoga sp.]|nr:YraN family protein [Pseudothermotoga sp.]HOK82726.1 YraN family protein [Pseudothermotoga sp.]HPP70836.1 YraN family protein [Pseudothermotoga sp.]
MNWKEAEKRAANYLRRKGFKVLECNYRTRFGEIDIIARYGKYLVFVEVKSGQSVFSPRTRVDMKKLHHIQLAANDYIMRNPQKCSGYRIDVVEVTENGIEHFEDVQT